MRGTIALTILWCAAVSLWAQQAGAAAPITLAEAQRLAKINSSRRAAAQAEVSLATDDHAQARSALLPQARYNNQFLYTQGRGDAASRYISGNGVHEYVSQAQVSQNLGLQTWAAYRQSAAERKLSQTRAVNADRSLEQNVTVSYYETIAAQRRLVAANEAAKSADDFVTLSSKLEAGGETAHSDSVKAQLMANDRHQAQREAQQQLLRARAEFAVLVFAQMTDDFTLSDSLDAASEPPSMEAAQSEVAKHHPELAEAMAELAAKRAEATTIKASLLPSLDINYFYGIDAAHFAAQSNGVRNLGYAASVTLNLPVFDWGASRSRVQQANTRLKLAQAQLNEAQRKAIADFRIAYGEAQSGAAALTDAHAAIDLASESLRLTTLRYQAGESSVLDVVDAQNALITAKNAYIDRLVRQRAALANLQMLMGVQQ